MGAAGWLMLFSSVGVGPMVRYQTPTVLAPAVSVVVDNWLIGGAGFQLAWFLITYWSNRCLEFPCICCA